MPSMSGMARRHSSAMKGASSGAPAASTATQYTLFNSWLCVSQEAVLWIRIWKKLSVADRWHFGMDPDPRIHGSDKWIRILPFSSLTFKTPAKHFFFFSFFCLFLFEGTFTLSFKEKKSEKSQNSRIKVFLARAASGSVPLTNGSGSRRPKKNQIRKYLYLFNWLSIQNTGRYRIQWKKFQKLSFSQFLFVSSNFFLEMLDLDPNPYAHRSATLDSQINKMIWICSLSYWNFGMYSSALGTWRKKEAKKIDQSGTK